MSNQDIFSFKRAGKYFVSDLKTCWSSYGLNFISICMIAPLAVYLVTILNNLIFLQKWSGPGVILRAIIFGIAIVVLGISQPTRCYGRITEKQFGSFYLSLPASRLEKFLSMIIISVIITPLLGIGSYLLIDSLICLIDKSCGDNLIYTISNIYSVLSEELIPRISEAGDIEVASVMGVVKKLTNPLLYIDDFIGCILPFLLGALCFKKNKVVKTILCIIAASIVLSFATAPFTNEFPFDGEQMISFFSHIDIIDTVSDTVVNLILLVAIYFRIKEIQH